MMAGIAFNPAEHPYGGPRPPETASDPFESQHDKDKAAVDAAIARMAEDSAKLENDSRGLRR